MSLIKTSEEIEALKEGGIILCHALQQAMKVCIAGASTEDIDLAARTYMEAHGAKPSFLGYKIKGVTNPFPSTVCISINDEVVHGTAHPARIIKEGDIVGLDIGCWYKGLATDMATTVIVGQVPEKVSALVADTRESLVRGLSTIKAKKTVMDIGAAIEDFLKPKKYGIVKDLVGHGVGHAVHEEPPIPNYRERGYAPVILKTGMVLAIEPMVTLGDWRVQVKSDQWTIITRDGSLAAHFEVTIAVTDTGYDLITPWPDV